MAKAKEAKLDLKKLDSRNTRTAWAAKVVVLPPASKGKRQVVVEVSDDEVFFMGRLLGAACGGRQFTAKEMENLKPLCQSICRAWMMQRETVQD